MEVLTREAEPPDAVVRYADHDCGLIDLFLPHRGSATGRPHEPHPLVVAIHGGFWHEKWDRTHLRPMANALVGPRVRRGRAGVPPRSRLLATHPRRHRLRPRPAARADRVGRARPGRHLVALHPHRSFRRWPPGALGRTSRRTDAGTPDRRPGPGGRPHRGCTNRDGGRCRVGVHRWHSRRTTGRLRRGGPDADAARQRPGGDRPRHRRHVCPGRRQPRGRDSARRRGIGRLRRARRDRALRARSTR